MACRFTREGERILYGVLGSGDLIGELACFTGLLQQMNAFAEGSATLVWVPLPQIDGLLEDEPQFARWLLSAMAHKMRLALDRIEVDSSLSAKARIARVLADLVLEEGQDLEITQQQLADFIGVSRVTVGQVLGALEREGLVQRNYSRIRVCNAGGLVELAG